ncbi:MAG: Stf0 family sulfotransferase [Pseudomonadota bacterium]
MTRPEAYILGTSPRSGSTLLCGLLTDSGVAGRPESYFHRPSLADWRDRLCLPVSADLSNVLRAAQHRGSAGTGMFGLRLQRHSVSFLLDQLSGLYPADTTDAGRITACFGETKYIYLKREDKIGQAVSLVRAQQGGLWHRNADGSERERLTAHANPVFDRSAIAAELSTLQRYDTEWEDWFDREAICPLRITYEDLSADPIATTRQILIWLGIDPASARPFSPAVRKLADATSADWVAQFLGGGCDN